MASTNNISNCYLLDALPVEVRIHIYEYILFEKGRFFSLDEEVGNSVVNLFPKLRSPPKFRKSAAEAPEEIEQAQTVTRSSGGIFSLLLTSRKVYTEAVEVLYANSFFRLRGIDATCKFINNAPPRYLNLVRSMKLVWDDEGWRDSDFDTVTLREAWPSLCAAFAQMKGLRDLYIGLGLNGDEHVEDLYVDSLHDITRVPNFKVCIPVGILSSHYGLATQRGYPGAPFTLCRHLAGEMCLARKEVMEAEWNGCSRPNSPAFFVPETGWAVWGTKSPKL